MWRGGRRAPTESALGKNLRGGNNQGECASTRGGTQQHPCICASRGRRTSREQRLRHTCMSPPLLCIRSADHSFTAIAGSPSRLPTSTTVSDLSQGMTGSQAFSASKCLTSRIISSAAELTSELVQDVGVADVCSDCCGTCFDRVLAIFCAALDRR